MRRSAGVILALLAGVAIGAMLLTPTARTPSAAGEFSPASLLAFAAALPVDEDAQELAGILAQAENASRPATPPARTAPSRRPSQHAVPPQRHDHVQAFTPEMIEHYIQVAKDIDLQAGKTLAEMYKNHPQNVEKYLRKAKRLQAMVVLKQRDPALYKMRLGEISQNVQVHRVAADLRSAIAKGASEGEINALRTQLETLVRIQMALSMKAKAETLCRLEDQIKELRAELDRDATAFASLVEARIEALLKQPASSAIGSPALIEDDDAGALPE